MLLKKFRVIGSKFLMTILGGLQKNSQFSPVIVLVRTAHQK